MKKKTEPIYFDVEINGKEKIDEIIKLIDEINKKINTLNQLGTSKRNLNKLFKELIKIEIK